MVNFASFDLNLLRVLDALLREGSTVRAGHLVGLSQPAVSAALGRLRHALGDPLFIRQGQKLVPTSFALRLEPPLRATLEGIEAFLSEPQGFDPSAATFDFCISSTDYFATMLVPELMAILQREAPGVRLKRVDLVPGNYIDAVDRNNADLAIIPEQALPAWLDHEPLFHPDFAVIARKDHPVLLDAGLANGDIMPLDLYCELRHVLCSPEGKYRGLGDAALERAGRTRQVVLSVPSFEGVLRAVVTTDLIALLPRDLAERYAASETITVHTAPILIETPLLYMIWHKRLTSYPAHTWMRGVVHRILAPLGKRTGAEMCGLPP